jgi:serine/threonine protein kinase
MPLIPGTRLSAYEILAPIGAGGMGEVYKARDSRLDRTVAVKILPSHVASDPTLRLRFEREAKALAAISHPHICSVYDVGQAITDQGTVDYLVMEHLEGETLAARLLRGSLIRRIAKASSIATSSLATSSSLQAARSCWTSVLQN